MSEHTPWAMTTIECLCCSQQEARYWPIPYGPDYIYAGICRSCKDER